ncbi:PKD domain-containing protein [Mucilaginibacter corticis]|uniref:PKD domain-containing protein n=1 Tax=Mucilaginibacter corticis TaxID=2597670 RepID=A0A556MHG6_9SPHI|nr:PKD domain-containing protein [Mucilaginibacter corticis]TSJ39282.1 PKD domain-containing protein [Mucilaginibacter corticis]
MPECFDSITFYKNLRVIIYASLLLFSFSYQSYAQSLGDPIVHITFGSGVNQYAGALKPDSGITTYQYVHISPEDDFYTIANSTEGMNPGWVRTTDHTGDPNGYMMIVNASYDPGLFYTRTVNGLCGSTTYQFGAFIKNICIGGILPNVTFEIEALDGTPLLSFGTGDIANNNWKQYASTFKTPASANSVVIKMINNAPGGGGNDLAIDDITFSPYGTTIGIAVDQGVKTYCANTPELITIKTTNMLDKGFSQKLQQLVNGVWVDQGIGGTDPSFTFPSPTVAGYYSYRLVKGDAGSINISKCVVASNQIDILVFPPPVAAFSVAETICQGDTSVFKDLSTESVSTIASRKWDFGDGQTSTEENPSHLYKTPGDKTVTLTVSNQNECTETATKIIHVIPYVNVDFDTSTPDCETRAVTFTDKSVSPEGKIISRVWDYGDSTTETKTDNTPFQHIYAKADYYVVKLTIKTDKGCTTTFSKSIKISPLPVVNFTLPKVCYADLSATFTDSTTIADNNIADFTYLWDFGDPNATANNPNTSTLKNPQHYYGQIRQYQVKLTITSADGCVVSTTKTLQVNGSPIPDFDVIKDQPLCANRDVFFVNNSKATIGNITKLIWYFDTTDLSVQEIDNDPHPGKMYRHTYPQTGRTYTVRLEAFTGDADVCHEVKEQTITVLQPPVISFAPPDSVCLNNGPVQLTSIENTGSAGTVAYTGTGVSGTVFDPVVAGLGTFPITCIYTSVNNCADTLTKNITVKPIPTVDAGPDATILAGGATTLHATATGDSVTYSWYPATGLSNSHIPDPVVSLNDDQKYILTVTNAEGCSVTDSLKVKVLQLPVVPNTFTPNNDGVNDTWVIKYLDTYIDCTVDVFNRYGQKVYTSLGYKIPWNGRFNNAELPVGVYYYIINPRHGRKTLSGYVTIIR